MTPPFLLAPPLILAGVLVIGAIAKLRTPDSADAWAELGVPAVFRRRWLQQLHPWGELLLAVLLVAAGGALGALAATGAVLLFGAYLVLVARSHRQHPGASCNCFGARRPITGRTVVRNVWYLVLAVATAAVTWSTPVLGGPLAGIGADWGWLSALVAVAITVWVSMPDAPAETPSAARTPIEGDQDEYVRTRTPAVPVKTGDGKPGNLRDLAMRQPILLLAVSEGCGSCLPVIEAMPRWRALLPEASVRFLLMTEPGESALTEVSEPQSLHDPNQYVRSSIDDWPTPTGLLIGADGYLAGGPVSGYDAIADFVGDIYESLHGERPTSI